MDEQKRQIDMKVLIALDAERSIAKEINRE
jgi:hypothetical protein